MKQKFHPVKLNCRLAILIGSGASFRWPHPASVKRSDRPEQMLSERSEFICDSESRERSSEKGAALNFWQLFFQEKSSIFAGNDSIYFIPI